MARRGAPVPSLLRRRCLITGAASGIGRATALAAARRGAELHLTDIDAAGLAETARLVGAGGGEVLTAEPLDITDHDGVLALAERIHAAHGSVDVAMNVAGTSTWGTIEALTHADWEAMIDIDLRGPISVLEAFVPPMIEAGRGGHVVNAGTGSGSAWSAPAGSRRRWWRRRRSAASTPTRRRSAPCASASSAVRSAGCGG
jgi:NAD(P)-dependent dehydrogenase (short-subunit alcohol dehydrogenase family)